MVDDVPEYHRRDSFDAPTISTIASGRNAVGVLTGEGEIHLITHSDATTLSPAEAGIDLGIGERLYYLTKEALQAISFDGTEVWSVPVNHGEAVAVTGTDDVLILTDRDELIGVDGTTGAELFSTGRPHPDIRTQPIIVGGADSWAVATWSYISHLNPSGEFVYDRDLDSTIRKVGIVDNLMVVATQNGCLVGLGIPTSTEAWTTDLTPDHLQSFGENELFLTVEDSIMVLNPDGETTGVPSLPPGEIFSSHNGDLVCVHRGDTVNVYERKAPLEKLEIGVEANSDASHPPETLSVEIGNSGTEPINAELHIEGDEVEVSPTKFNISVGSGELEQAAIDILSAEPSGKITIFSPSMEELAAYQLTGERSDFPDSIEFTREQIVDGTLELMLSQESIDSEYGVYVGDRQIASVSSDDPQFGMSMSDVTSDYNPEIRTDEYVIQRVAIDLPDEPVTLSIYEAEGGFIDVSITNETTIQLNDTIRVRAEFLPTDIVRDLSLEAGGTMIVSVPVVGAQKRASISCELIGLGKESTRRVDLRKESIGTTLTTENSTDSLDSKSIDSNEAISVDQTVSTTTPSPGQAVHERINLKNRGGSTVSDIELVDTDVVDLPPLEPDQAVTLERMHGFASAGSYELDKLQIRWGNVPHKKTVPTRSISVESTGIGVSGSIEKHQDMVKVNLQIQNYHSIPIVINRIGLHQIDVWTVDELQISDGKRKHWSTTLPTEKIQEQVIPLALAYTKGEETLKSLFLIGVSGAIPISKIETLSVSLTDETKAEIPRGSIVVELTNTGEELFRNISVEGNGKAVDDLIYGGQANIERLEPGESISHLIDLNHDSQESVTITLDVDVETENGEQYRESIHIQGPVIEEGNWTDDLLNDWDVSRDHAENDLVSDHLKTSFKIED